MADEQLLPQSVAIRFLIFPSGKEFTKTFPNTYLFRNIKKAAFSSWPEGSEFVQPIPTSL